MGWINFYLRKEANGNIRQDLQGTMNPAGYLNLGGRRRNEIWAVGGGKGGVGKSLVSSNVGISLSRKGKRVLMIDADLGAANLHTIINTHNGKFSLSTFLDGEVSDFSLVIGKTSIPNLDLVSGANDSLEVANITSSKLKLLQIELENLNYDYVLMDVGPGTSPNMLDLFLMSDKGMLVTTPEPTSIENTYRFIKALFLRRVKYILNSGRNGELKVLLKKYLNDGSAKTKTMAQLFNILSRLDGHVGRLANEVLGNTNLFLVINKAKNEEDKMVGRLINRACLDYFGIDVPYLGCIHAEDIVDHSIRMRKPLSVFYDYTEASKSIEGITNNLLQENRRTKFQNNCK